MKLNCGLEVYGIIYKIENKMNGKVYIGQTTNNEGFKGRYYRSGNTLIERCYNYHNQNKIYGYYYNSHLLSAMNKYGLENFIVNDFFDFAFSKEELDIKEQSWILIYDSVKNGYNLNYGGSNGKASEHTKNIMRELNKGENNPRYGIEVSNETKKKMRENHWSKTGIYKPISKKGKDSPNYGKHHSEETKKKISNSNKGKILSEETKKKMSNTRQGSNNPSSRKIICITTDKVFDCIKDAGAFYNCDNSGISKCCRGKEKHCGKLQDGTKLSWMYYEDYEKIFLI